jgi:hypothetical protein
MHPNEVLPVDKHKTKEYDQAGKFQL